MAIPKHVSAHADQLVKVVMALPRTESSEAILGLTVILLSWASVKLRQDGKDDLAQEYDETAKYFDALASEKGLVLHRKIH